MPRFAKGSGFDELDPVGRAIVRMCVDTRNSLCQLARVATPNSGPITSALHASTADRVADFDLRQGTPNPEYFAVTRGGIYRNKEDSAQTLIGGASIVARMWQIDKFVALNFTGSGLDGVFDWLRTGVTISSFMRNPRGTSKFPEINVWEIALGGTKPMSFAIAIKTDPRVAGRFRPHIGATKDEVPVFVVPSASPAGKGSGRYMRVTNDRPTAVRAADYERMVMPPVRAAIRELPSGTTVGIELEALPGMATHVHSFVESLARRLEEFGPVKLTETGRTGGMIT